MVRADAVGQRQPDGLRRLARGKVASAANLAAIGLSVYDHGFDETVIVLDLPQALVVTGASGEVAVEREPGELLDLLGGRAHPLSLPRGKHTATVVVDTGPVAGKLTASIPVDVRTDPPPAVAKPPSRLREPWVPSMAALTRLGKSRGSGCSGPWPSQGLCAW